MSQQPAPPQEPNGFRPSPWEVGQRTIKEIVEALAKPLAQEHIKMKIVGKGDRQTEVPYIPWYVVVKVLDYHAPGWGWKITSIVPIQGRVALSGRLTIPANENGVIVRYSHDATGTEPNETDAYGDPVSNSESMAFRRAASKFRLGLFLYERERPQQQGGYQQQGQGQAPGAPRQYSGTPPPISAKQMGLARYLASEKGIDEHSASMQMFQRPLDQLNVAEGSQLIDAIKAYGGGQAPQQPQAPQGYTAPQVVRPTVQPPQPTGFAPPPGAPLMPAQPPLQPAQPVQPAGYPPGTYNSQIGF